MPREMYPQPFAPGDRSSNSYGERGRREGDCERPSHEAPGNHAFLPSGSGSGGWAQGLQSAASPVVVSSFLTDPIGCS
ncbi:hypothetical protein Lal_00038481 [Lupinus albus]|nr:hypothetical protein Lal_00038481 [Lupinus albus]